MLLIWTEEVLEDRRSQTKTCLFIHTKIWIESIYKLCFLYSQRWFKEEKETLLVNIGLNWYIILLDLNPSFWKDLKNKPYKWGFYPINAHKSRIYPLILKMLKRWGLIRFGDAIIMYRDSTLTRITWSGWDTVLFLW